jgi:hypothetical protein
MFHHPLPQAFSQPCTVSSSSQQGHSSEVTWSCADETWYWIITYQLPNVTLFGRLFHIPFPVLHLKIHYSGSLLLTTRLNTKIQHNISHLPTKFSIISNVCKVYWSISDLYFCSFTLSILRIVMLILALTATKIKSTLTFFFLYFYLRCKVQFEARASSLVGLIFRSFLISHVGN